MGSDYKKERSSSGKDEVILLSPHLSYFAWPLVLFNPFKDPFNGRFNTTTPLCGSL